MKATTLSPMVTGTATLLVLCGLSFASLPPPVPADVSRPDPAAEPDPTYIAPNERGWRKADVKTETESKERLWRDDWRPDRVELPDRDAMAQPAARKAVSDREIVRQVSRAVKEDGSLSVAGRKVKIVSQAGTITLRGRVLNDAERASIAAKAAAVVGADKVVNLMTVKKTPKAK